MIMSEKNVRIPRFLRHQKWWFTSEDAEKNMRILHRFSRCWTNSCPGWRKFSPHRYSNIKYSLFVTFYESLSHLLCQILSKSSGFHMSCRWFCFYFFGGSWKYQSLIYFQDYFNKNNQSLFLSVVSIYQHPPKEKWSQTFIVHVPVSSLPGCSIL